MEILDVLGESVRTGYYQNSFGNLCYVFKNREGAWVLEDRNRTQFELTRDYQKHTMRLNNLYPVSLAEVQDLLDIGRQNASLVSRHTSQRKIKRDVARRKAERDRARKERILL